MDFYVASKFANYRNVRAVVDALKERGHDVTFDWTRTNEFDPDTGELICNPETDLAPSEKAEFAVLDARGALQCDRLVLLWVPDMAGAYVEMGMALAASRPVDVIGEVERWTIFYSHPLVAQWPSVEAYLARLDA